MKKPAQNCLLLMVIATGLCLASYGTKNQQKLTYNINYDKSLDSYQEYISSLNPNNLFTIDAAVEKFRKTFVHCPTNITDAAFLKFWNFYLTAADFAGDRLAQNERYKYLAGIKDYNLKQGSYKSLEYKLILGKHVLNKNDFRLLNLLNSCGLMFDIRSTRLIINFGSNNFILNSFGNYISPAMRDYISETIKEAGEALIENDKLVLPRNKLAERVAWWRSFINRNKNFILISECKSTYEFYHKVLLQGLPNNEVRTAEVINSNNK